MTNSKILCVSFTCIYLVARQACAQQDGYSITASPDHTVADGTSGEEVYVKWQTPFGAITVADAINFYAILTNETRLVWFKQEVLRDGDTQFIFKDPGNYKVSYMHFSFFNYIEKASVPVTVAPTTSLVPTAKNYPPSGTKVIVFGDSLTEGVGATKSNLVDWLQSYTSLPIINAGRSGDTTADALGRLDRDVLQKKPNVVVVFLGGNDLLDQKPVSETQSNLTEIVEKIQATGAMTVIVGVYGGLLTDRYREMFHTLYTTTKSPFVPDILAGIPENPFLIGNSLHPNDQGYRRMATRIAPILNAIFATKPPESLELAISQGDSITLRWNSKPGQYELLSSPTVDAPLSHWKIVQTISATNTPATIGIEKKLAQEFFMIRQK